VTNLPAVRRTAVPVHEDQNRDNRTLPLNAPAIPATLGDGWQVIAFAFTPARTGEKPNQGVAVVRQEDRPIMRAYAFLRACAPHDGEWEAWGGTYDCPYAEALRIFTEELTYCI
jgi:hypothetical protein